MAKGKLRRKADGTIELPEVPCPTCGTRNLGVNATTGEWNCWVCNRGGRLNPLETRQLATALGAGSSPTESREPGPLTTLPPLARKAIERRGASPEWLEHRYGVRWDGERLWWPAGKGASRRAIWPWESPKTLTVAPRGLIGEHLLKPGALVVVTEGDFKAAAIPLPWVGVGLMGDAMSDAQAETLGASQPAAVIIILDGGFRHQADAVARKIALLSPRVVDLPEKHGPDDVDRGDLFRILGGW